ncbi:MAG TPA: VCBS repeat-containing protein [Pyrinomonadaceae bacterium]|nr:VCBS repeat-containing protein [Pyrinomonadaceae bacterium]
MRSCLFLVLALIIVITTTTLAQQNIPDLRKSSLKSATPSDEIVRLDVNNDGKPDILERWWNGKRVRWLDENGDMQPTDTRGDQVGDVLQVDKNGDGLYDGPNDMNIKWADNDGDGQADLEAFVTQPPEWGPDKFNAAESHWMVFIDVEKDGVLGWLDWTKFDFANDNWGYTGTSDWLPDYNGNAIFLKVHRPPQSLPDPRLNWENPFAFFDYDGDGVSEMAMRWLDPVPALDKDQTKLSGVLGEAFVTFDLDNDSTKGNETDYDMSLRGVGGPGIPYKTMVHKYPALKGNPRFNECFQWNNWRQIDELMYMPHEKSYSAFFTAGWKTLYFVFDEDDDDHRWERVEMYYPMHGFGGPKDIDIYSTKRWRRSNYAEQAMVAEGEKPGLDGHPQSDSLGDRGEFDEDNSGGGKLYVGVFDRKFHLAGAEWGAWTVDKNAEFHGGVKTPSPKPLAQRVEEVVKYTDTDNNGFLDTVEYDYDGDRTIDFKFSLLDFKTLSQPHPDVVALIDTHKEGWKGLNALFTSIANQSFQEALSVYHAAWRRGLTTPEIDKLAYAGAIGERYDHGYWLKEKVFRQIRARLQQIKQVEPAKAAALDKLEKDLAQLYYTGKFDEYTRRIAEVPGL